MPTSLSLSLHRKGMRNSRFFFGFIIIYQKDTQGGKKVMHEIKLKEEASALFEQSRVLISSLFSEFCILKIFYD